MAANAGITIEVGQRVNIPKSGDGVVAFAGNTSFAQGRWVGIVLDEPLGKNNGSVQVSSKQGLKRHRRELKTVLVCRA